MAVAVLVPRRADGGRRDAVWSWVRERWAAEHPSFEVIEGACPDGPFNRSAAINDAASQTDADILIIADADSFASAAQIDMAVDQISATRAFWLPYDTYRYLSRAMSDAVMDGFSGDWLTGVEFSMTGTCSSVVIVTTELFGLVGGFDEGFQGWGFEDVAFSHAAQTFGGGVSRVPGDVWHLWHTPSTENNHNSPIWQANRERMERYAVAAYDPGAMGALIGAR